MYRSLYRARSLLSYVSYFRVRELTTAKVGTLLRITGQVVRTHPVHPELVKGTFVCLDCQTVIKDVEQQFNYTQVRIKRSSFLKLRILVVSSLLRVMNFELCITFLAILEYAFTEKLCFHCSLQYVVIRPVATEPGSCWM